MRLFSNMLTFNRIKDGEPGGVGPIPVPEGSWNKNTEYERNKYKAPIVEYKNLMYFLNKDGTFKGINPQEDYAQNGMDATWILVPNYQLLIVNALIAEFGKIGGAVFYGDMMISQKGVDKAGNPSPSFEKYPADFTPNLSLDFKGGELIANKGSFRGVLSQTFVDIKDAKYIDNSKTLSVSENSSIYCKSPGKTSVALPTELSYNGFRVCVYNTGTSYSISGGDSWVNTEIEITTNGKSRLCRSVRRSSTGQIHREFSDKFIVELGCYVEFVACPNRSIFGGTEQIDIVWMINEVIQVKG